MRGRNRFSKRDPMTHSFDPADDPTAYRAALGRFATGVTIITTHDTAPVGITANSFASVSLDPPLVLWCVDKGSDRADVFLSADHFAINVLGAHQAELALAFAARADAFAGLALRPHPQRVPVLEDCVAHFDCARHAVHEAGDHWLILGRVLSACSRTGAPLVFHDGALTPLP